MAGTVATARRLFLTLPGYFVNVRSVRSGACPSPPAHARSRGQDAPFHLWQVAFAHSHSITPRTLVSDG